MGDLRDKLRRTVSGGAPGSSGLRAYLEQRRARLAGAPRPRVELGAGEERSNSGGAFWLRSERLPLSSIHGWFPLELARRTDWAWLSGLARDESIGSASLGECLFVDTETTGLSAGAGTTVFLVGLGFVDGAELVLEQAFLRSFEDEPAALQHVAARIAERPLQVTFVGKSFDRHRLHSRMTLHRIRSAVLDPRHLDLYHLARRRWKAELPDCRLRTVEEQRLGLRRHGDLAGSEAPRAWLEWLHDRTGAIDRVFEHNRLDVLSLVTLLGALGTVTGEAAC